LKSHIPIRGLLRTWEGPLVCNCARRSDVSMFSS
jgi:hypothetical protein